MSNAGWGWDRNWIQQGRLTASSEVVGLGIGNLQDERGGASTGWQTVGTEAFFVVDALDAVLWRALVLARTNLTPNALVRWRVGNDPTFATWSFDAGWTAGPARGVGQVVTILPAVDSAVPEQPVKLITEDGLVLMTEAQQVLLIEVGMRGRYARCDIVDPLNPDGFLNIGLAYGGPLVQTQRNFSYGTSLGRTQGGTDVRTRSGAMIRNLHWTARRWNVDLKSLMADEIWPFVMDLDLYGRRGGNVLFVPNPDSPNVSREAVFGLLTPTADVSVPNHVFRAWSATIEERL